jgi:predicted membrane GTPase involved in stress response
MDGVARGYAKMRVTPKSLRMRKILLDENDRKKAGKVVMEQ